MVVKIRMIAYLFLIILPCCATKPSAANLEMEDQQPIAIANPKFEEIVLVNAGEINRCEMGALIRSISKCEPKVIGINFLFVEEKEPKCDSILRDAIYDSDNVVLLASFKDGKMITPHQKFASAAFLTGPNIIVEDDNDITTRYHRMIDYRGKWEIGFPFLIATQFDKSHAAKLSSKLAPVEYPITFYGSLDDFRVFNHDADFVGNREYLKDKIVLVGYLGPTNEDLYKTPVMKSSGKTYGTVVVANNILDILKND